MYHAVICDFLYINRMMLFLLMVKTNIFVIYLKQKFILSLFLKYILKYHWRINAYDRFTKEYMIA